MNSFGFNGQERKDDWRGKGNSYDFGARNYEARIGRFSSLDPQASKLPSISPYVFSLNSPISMIDPDGEFPIYFLIRRYDHSSYFGFPMISKGDDRQTNASIYASARVHHMIGVETNTSVATDNPIIYNRAYSSETQQYTLWPGKGTETPRYTASGQTVANTDGISAVNFQFKNSGEQPVAKKGLSSHLVPAIDTRGNIGINVFKDRDEMEVFGSIGGDNFPDGEAFIYDNIGQGINLGDYKHPWYGSPMWSLQGEGSSTIMKFDIFVKLDKDGNFRSAYYKLGNRTIDLKIQPKTVTNFNFSKPPEKKDE